MQIVAEIFEVLISLVLDFIKWIFIKDPCKKCLVKACCMKLCKEKVKYNSNFSVSSRIMQVAGLGILICIFDVFFCILTLIWKYNHQ